MSGAGFTYNRALLVNLVREAHLQDARAICKWCGKGEEPYRGVAPPATVEAWVHGPGFYCDANPIWDALSHAGISARGGMRERATTFSEPPNLERRVTFQAAWDKRRGGHGVNSVTMRLALVGEHGAVEVEVLTGWHLPEVVDGWEGTTGRIDSVLLRPIPAAVRYHYRKPDEDAAGRMFAHGAPPYEGCPLLGSLCHDGGASFVDADTVFGRLVREGDAGLWAAIEERYVKTFGEAR
jgi:hypothetical protein